MKKFLTVLVILLVAAILAVSGLLAYQLVQRRASLETAERNAAMISASRLLSPEFVMPTPEATPEPALEGASGEPEATPEPTPEVTYSEVLTGMQNINGDIIGVLEWADDSSLYVLQGVDNDFYMDHDFEGNPDTAGALFLDTRNSLEPRNTNWIIYGHNMKSGACFGNLNVYRDADYIAQHPYITLTLLHHKYTYTPFAVLDVDVEPGDADYFKITEWDFDTDEAFNAYVGYYLSHSFFDLGVDVSPDDHLLLLCTCSYSYSNGRLLVACKQVAEE